MKCYIGIDGGGTKTELIITDKSGNIINREVKGSSNPNDIGRKKCLELIESLIKDNIPEDCDEAELCAGISGCKVAGCESYISEKIKSDMPFIKKIIICSDITLSCVCNDGDNFCSVIIGTGSVAVVKKSGKISIIGGGGYLIDEDLSGFSLGKQVLNCILSAEDGRDEQTLLTDLFYKKTGYIKQYGFRNALKEVYEKGKMFIASFSPLVFEAYLQGDNAAKNILKKSIYNFEKLVMAGYNKLGEEHINVTVFGGLVNQFDIIKQFFSKDINEKITFKFTDLPIIFGTFRLLDVGFENQYKENFLKDYKKLVYKII